MTTEANGTIKVKCQPQNKRRQRSNNCHWVESSSSSCRWIIPLQVGKLHSKSAIGQRNTTRHWKWRKTWQTLSLCETQEQSCGLENATRTYMDIMVSNKWVKFQFWVKYPFKWTKYTFCRQWKCWPSRTVSQALTLTCRPEHDKPQMWPCTPIRQPQSACYGAF